MNPECQGRGDICRSPKPNPGSYDERNGRHTNTFEELAAEEGPAASTSGTYAERAEQYAKDVCEKKIVACVEVRQACKRHLDYLKRSRKPGYAGRSIRSRRTASAGS